MQMHPQSAGINLLKRAEVATPEHPHAGNHKVLEIKVTGSLGKAHRFVYKILPSPRNRPRCNRANSLKTQKELRWKNSFLYIKQRA